MRTSLLLVLPAVLAIAACTNTPTERALIGGAVGLAAADALDANPTAGVAVGALAGVASCGAPGLMPCN